MTKPIFGTGGYCSAGEYHARDRAAVKRGGSTAELKQITGSVPPYCDFSSDIAACQEGQQIVFTAAIQGVWKSATFTATAAGIPNAFGAGPYTVTPDSPSLAITADPQGTLPGATPCDVTMLVETPVGQQRVDKLAFITLSPAS